LKEYYVYKMINAWGNSFSANEFYASGRPSVIDNRFLKTKETSDAPIINAFLKEETKTPKTRTGSTVTKTIYTAPKETVSGPTSNVKINIYAGTGENAELSNFANRPTTYNTSAVEGFFGTPEGAFQAAKISYTENLTDEQKIDNSIIFEKLKSASGSQAKSLGRTIKGLNQSDWNNDSSDVMLDILIDSFRQNPNALAKLLATGNAELTHTQDTGKWGKEFPRLLMEVREELRPIEAVTNVKISTPSGKLKLKDGNEYLISDINSELLKSIGYKPTEIGKLLKSIC
jgi:predicted NAD-dependent protein-ADP-ribosyltransferase YbiA (DUF1768 family)